MPIDKLKTAYEDLVNDGLIARGVPKQAAQTCEDYPMREGLMAKLRNRSYHCKQEASRYNALEELLKLLESEPTIARILELMDQVGV